MEAAADTAEAAAAAELGEACGMGDGGVQPCERRRQAPRQRSGCTPWRCRGCARRSRICALPSPWRLPPSSRAAGPGASHPGPRPPWRAPSAPPPSRGSSPAEARRPCASPLVQSGSAEQRGKQRVSTHAGGRKCGGPRGGGGPTGHVTSEPGGLPRLFFGDPGSPGSRSS